MTPVKIIVGLLFIFSTMIIQCVKSGEKKSGWSENWESWSDNCDCSCGKKKGKKTVAIVIPKYEFVEIPLAKEIPSKGLDGMKSVEIDEEKYGGKDEHEMEEEDDETSYEWKRRNGDGSGLLHHQEK